MTSRKARDRSSASFNELVRELSYPDTTEATFAASKVNRFKVVDSFVYRSDVSCSDVCLDTDSCSFAFFVQN